MRKWWPIVMTFVLIIGGAVFAHYGYDVLGLGLMLGGALFAWAWAFWPDIRNLFKARSKHP